MYENGVLKLVFHDGSSAKIYNNKKGKFEGVKIEAELEFKHASGDIRECSEWICFYDKLQCEVWDIDDNKRNDCGFDV